MLKCKWCHYEWLPRADNPKKCPKCGTRNWNEENSKKEEKKCQI